MVRKTIPCAFYMDTGKGDDCRWCARLYHVKVHETSTTLCGHACTHMEDWAPLVDWHPEDVPAIDRCQVCYSRIKKEEGRL